MSRPRLFHINDLTRRGLYIPRPSLLKLIFNYINNKSVVYALDSNEFP